MVLVNLGHVQVHLLVKQQMIWGKVSHTAQRDCIQTLRGLFWADHKLNQSVFSDIPFMIQVCQDWSIQRLALIFSEGQGSGPQLLDPLPCCFTMMYPINKTENIYIDI